MRQGALRGVLAGALGLALMLAAGEVLVRLGQPTPRLQVVPGDALALVFDEHEGVPLWHEPLDPPLVRGACDAAGRPVVLLAGDSVFKVGAGQPRVRDVLQEALGEAACVLDASQSGYVPWQQLAVARREHARVGLDLLVLQVWKSDRRYLRVGNDLIDAEAVARDARGTPVGPVDLPDALHRWLFEVSDLWRYASLALAPPAPPPRPADAAYREALAWARAQGVGVVLVEAAPLDRPLATTAAERAALLAGEGAVDFRHWAVDLHRDALREGVPYVYLPQALEGEDLDALRLDTCCHLLPAGHAAVARALAPVVAAALAAP